jgi:hypothetical protein
MDAAPPHYAACRMSAISLLSTVSRNTLRSAIEMEAFERCDTELHQKNED